MDFFNTKISTLNPVKKFSTRFSPFQVFLEFKNSNFYGRHFFFSYLQSLKHAITAVFSLPSARNSNLMLTYSKLTANVHFYDFFSHKQATRKASDKFILHHQISRLTSRRYSLLCQSCYYRKAKGEKEKSVYMPCNDEERKQFFLIVSRRSYSFKIQFAYRKIKWLLLLVTRDWWSYLSMNFHRSFCHTHSVALLPCPSCSRNVKSRKFFFIPFPFKFIKKFTCSVFFAIFFVAKHTAKCSHCAIHWNVIITKK